MLSRRVLSIVDSFPMSSFLHTATGQALRSTPKDVPDELPRGHDFRRVSASRVNPSGESIEVASRGVRCARLGPAGLFEATSSGLPRVLPIRGTEHGNPLLEPTRGSRAWVCRRSVG